MIPVGMYITRLSRYYSCTHILALNVNIFEGYTCTCTRSDSLMISWMMLDNSLRLSMLRIALLCIYVPFFGRRLYCEFDQSMSAADSPDVHIPKLNYVLILAINMIVTKHISCHLGV